MNFSRNLRFLRKQHNHSQEFVAQALHYKSFTTVQKWEDGTSTPSYRIIGKLAELYDVTIDQIMNQDLTQPAYVDIPILGTVRGGMPLYASQVYMGHEPVRIEEAMGGEYFYLEVVGDSMKGDRILPGDILYVRRQSTLNSGEIGIVLLDESEATVKRVYFKNNGMILQPSNDDYEPIVLNKEDMQNRHVQILGKVIHNKIRY